MDAVRFAIRSAVLGLCCCLAESALAVPSIVVTPSSGGLGTVITLEVSPHTTGYELDNAQTTASWSGVYQPPVGSPSGSFSAAFSAAQVNVTSPWTAEIILGQGSFTNAPNPLTLAGFGTLQGTISLQTPAGCPADVNADGRVDIADFSILSAHFGQSVAPGTNGDITGDGVVNIADFSALTQSLGQNPCPASPVVVVSGATSVGIQSNAATWHSIVDPDGPGGISPPELWSAPTSIVILRLSLLPNPTQPAATMLTGATDMHGAAVVRIKQNPSTEASAPATLTADVVSLNNVGAEVSRINGLVLSKLANDGDPANIVYVSDLSKPLIVVDTVLNQAQYPGFVFLLGTTTGSVVIVPD